MSARNWIIAVLLFVVWVSFGSSTSARELHVAQTGSDSGSGSEAEPFATIGQAAAVAMPDDTVIVHGGTYRE